MPRIRIPEEHWDEVWMALVEVGAISRVSVEPVYLVSKKHIDVLQEKNLPFEFVDSRKLEVKSLRQQTRRFHLAMVRERRW
jgi:hypothetical protein